MKNFNDFFPQEQLATEISKKDLEQLINYNQLLEAFSRITHNSMYVIDFHTKSFEYVSSNPLFLCGYTPQEVQKLGVEFYFNVTKPEDIALLHIINQAGMAFFKPIPIHERTLYSMSYDYHIMTAQKMPLLIHHKITPLFITEEGKFWKSMCIVSRSTHKKAGNIQIFKKETNETWKFNIKTHKWILTKKIKLHTTEIHILNYYASGLSIAQTANQLCISQATIKYHRAKLFEKLNVTNIIEAYDKAIELNLF